MTRSRQVVESEEEKTSEKNHFIKVDLEGKENK